MEHFYSNAMAATFLNQCLMHHPQIVSLGVGQGVVIVVYGDAGQARNGGGDKGAASSSAMHQAVLDQILKGKVDCGVGHFQFAGQLNLRGQLGAWRQGTGTDQELEMLHHLLPRGNLILENEFFHVSSE